MHNSTPSKAGDELGIVLRKPEIARLLQRMAAEGFDSVNIHFQAGGLKVTALDGSKSVAVQSFVDKRAFETGYDSPGYEPMAVLQKEWSAALKYAGHDAIKALEPSIQFKVSKTKIAVRTIAAQRSAYAHTLLSAPDGVTSLPKLPQPDSAIMAETGETGLLAEVRAHLPDDAIVRLSLRAGEGLTFDALRISPVRFQFAVPMAKGAAVTQVTTYGMRLAALVADSAALKTIRIFLKNEGMLIVQYKGEFVEVTYWIANAPSEDAPVPAEED